MTLGDDLTLLRELKLSRAQREGLADILKRAKRLSDVRAMLDALNRNGRIQTHLGAPTRASVLRAVLVETRSWIERGELFSRALKRCDPDTTRSLLDGTLRALVNRSREVKRREDEGKIYYRIARRRRA